MTSLRRLSSLGILLVFLFAISCTRNPVTGKKEINLMSEQQEVAIGAQNDPAIVAMYGRYQDEDLQKFIDEMGQSMAKISHRNHLDFEFKILDSDVVNAFAVPGGYVYFTRGIMAHFNNKAEFAGVLGHEIGHISARHSARQYTSQVFGQVLLIGGLVVSPEFRQFGDVAMQSMGLLFMSFSRKHESESDDLGVEYSTEIGYDAHQMADFFQTMYRISTKDGNELIPTFQSTHPNPLDRYQDVHNLAEKAQKKDERTEYNVGRDEYLRMIDGIVYGKDPRQGFVENGKFYHPELKFFYDLPAGWQTVNTPAQVQMGEPEGRAVMYLSLGEGNSLQEALNNEISNNNLTLVEQQQLNVNGNKAIAAESYQTGQDQQGQEVTVRVLHYFIEYGEYIYKFTGATYGELFVEMRPIFQNTMQSFHKLTDPTKLNRQPERIKIEAVPRDMTVAEALRQFRTPTDRIEELAILNGMQQTDNLSKGSLIKTIGGG